MSTTPHSIPDETLLSDALPHREARRRDRLREHLLDLPYPAFEQLIMQLLQHSGYASVHIAGRKHKRGRFESCNQCINGQRIEDSIILNCYLYPGSRSRGSKSQGSGGCDLRACNHTDLTTAITVVQIKQYRHTVPRRFVDELRGTMLRLQATHGLLITTSVFSHVAQGAAEHCDVAPIRLVDSNSLLDLLIRHQIGVRATATGWKIDRRWLDRLAKSATSGAEAGCHGSTVGSTVPASCNSTTANRCIPKPITSETDTCKTNKTKCLPTPSKKTFLHRLATIYPLNRIRAAIRPATDCRKDTNFDDSGGPMLWRTHVLAGVSSLWLLEIVPTAINSDNIPLLIGVAAFGALLPDLDAAESKIKHLSIKGIKPFYLPAQAVHRHFAHRGFSHSLSGLALLALFAGVLGPWWGWPTSLALILGYASHLAADACTRSGIRWLFPSRRRYHLLPPSWRFVTGSQAEDVLFPLLALLVLSLLLHQLSFGYSF